MASKDELMILRHDKARYRDIAGHLVLHRRLRGSKYEEHKSGVSASLDEARIDWVAALSLLIQKLFSVISFPLLCLGHIVEFFLNLHSLNGGFFGIFWGCLTDALCQILQLLEQWWRNHRTRTIFDPFFVFSMYLNAVGDLTKDFLLAYLQNDFDEGFVSLMYRASGLFIPGLASHSPRDYLNGGDYGENNSS